MSIVDTSSTKGDTIEILLRQLGASKITKVKGYLYFIKFQVDGLEISYAYNINHKNQYFLQRIEPYPLPKGVFSNEIEIVSFIKKDVEKFGKAMKSNNFNTFLNFCVTFNSLSTDIENLFLNYDICDEDINELEKYLNKFCDKIRKCEGDLGIK